MTDMRSMLRAVALGFAFVSVAAIAQAAECPTDVEAAIGAACPCADDGHGQPWPNHGQYVSCVVRFRNDLRRDGCLNAQTQRTIARCAARSTCGKEGAVLCCTYDTSGTCDLTTGTCTNDATLACLTNTDCITVIKGPKVKRHDINCTEHGGTIVGTGSVCAGCPLPPPAP